MSEFSARGKVVVVTGGANGIGAALCRRFASEGASKVVVVDLNVGVAESLAATLPEHVGVAVGADCGSELDLRRVIVQTEFEHGPSMPHRARTPAWQTEDRSAAHTRKLRFGQSGSSWPTPASLRTAAST